MSKETMAKLFKIDANLSTRGTDNEKGTGLGLLLCKEFADKHNGKLWVESEEGKGSTFKLLLPLDVTKPVFIT
jgi:signal transduction histidine kinase